MTTYYVHNTDGLDTNSGLSEALPFKTISKIQSLTLSPGDTVKFACGEVWREMLSNPEAGTSGNLITFTSYGTGDKPMIDGSNIVTSWSLYSGTIYRAVASEPSITYPGVYTSYGSYPILIHSAGNYATLSLGTFDYEAGYLYINIGTNPSSYTIEHIYRAYGIQNMRSYIKLDGLHFRHHHTAVGQYNYASAGCEVVDCDFDYCSNQGIYTGQSATYYASNWWVHDCTFSYTGVAVNGRHGIYTKWATGWTIENNTFTYCGWGVVNGGFGVNLNGTTNSIVRYNWFEDSNGSGAIQLFEDTAGPSTGNQIYYNIAHNVRRFIYIAGGTTHANNLVYNNTCYGIGYAGINIEADCAPGTFKNNIMWVGGSGGKAVRIEAGATVSASDYNIFGPEASDFIMYNGTYYDTLAAYVTATGLDTHSSKDDPLFTDAGNEDFSIQSTSPALNAAYDWGQTRDYAGTSQQGSAWDIGALERFIGMNSAVHFMYSSNITLQLIVSSLTVQNAVHGHYLQNVVPIIPYYVDTLSTFTWVPSAQPELRKLTRVLSARFGDGYAQEVADGINSNTESWSLTFSGVTNTIADEIDTFLSTCGGYSAFWWESPTGLKTYKCKDWTRIYITNDHSSLSMTFEQAFVFA